MFSSDSTILFDLHQEAKVKIDGYRPFLIESLGRVCSNHEFLDPNTAALSLYEPPTKNEIHRFMEGRELIVIVFHAGNIYIGKKEIGRRPRKIGFDHFYEAVALGNGCEFKRHSDRKGEGWWIFDYGIPEIDLRNFSYESVGYIANFLGYDLSNDLSTPARNTVSRKKGTASIYGSIQKWINKHPQIAKKYLDNSCYDDWHSKGIHYSKDLDYKGVAVSSQKKMPKLKPSKRPSVKVNMDAIRKIHESIWASLPWHQGKDVDVTK